MRLASPKGVIQLRADRPRFGDTGFGAGGWLRRRVGRRLIGGNRLRPSRRSSKWAYATEPVAGSVAAIDVLAFVSVETEHPEGYLRERFGYPADADGDGCDTRANVLTEEAARAHVGTAGGRCEAVAGEWTSRYDDLEVTDPNELEVDHVVALKEAHDSGAWAWDAER